MSSTNLLQIKYSDSIGWKFSRGQDEILYVLCIATRVSQVDVL